MNKKKFVFWKKPTGDVVTDGFSRNPEYHAFFQKCNEAFDFRFANGRESYLGDGKFAEVFKYEKGRIVPAESEFVADAVYQFNKVTDETFDNAVPICNTEQFRKWCGDKWSQYELLKDYMPLTFAISSQEDLAEKILQITTSKAVVKPRSGKKGEDVVVFDAHSLPALDPEILAKKGYLLQEFSDTNIEVSGIVSGIHDIKLITIDDAVFANLRTPDTEGKEFCTYDSPYSEIAVKDLPPSVLDLHSKVKALVNASFPGQIYTVDIGITKKGPVVFELNPHTAFPYIHFDYAEDFLRAFVGHFQRLADTR